VIIKFSKKELRLTLWAVLVFSYPVAAILNGTLPFLRFIPVGCMLLAAFLSFVKVQEKDRAMMTLFLLLFLFVQVFAIAHVFQISDIGKIYSYLSVLFIFGVLNFLIFFNEALINRIHVVFMLLGLMLVIMFLANPSEYQEQRMSFEDTNPIWMARALGLSALGAFFWWLRSEKLSLFPIVVIAVSLYTIILTGSRGPLLAVFVSMLVGLALVTSRQKSLKIIFSSIAVMIVAFLVLEFNLLGSTRGLVFFGENDGTTQIRMETFLYAFSEILNNPYGIGAGNFYFNWQHYPHNIFLEFVLEWGWIAGGMTVLLIVSGCLGLFFFEHRYEFLKLLLTYELLNAAVSGDITSPRFLYGLVLYGNYKILIWVIQHATHSISMAPVQTLNGSHN
jgi:O-Antigen ligase